MVGIFIFCLFRFSTPAEGQDLEPRAYARVPVNITLLSAGFTYSKGDVVTDATLNLKDLNAAVEVLSIGVGQTFRMFGLTTQAFVSLPFCITNATALVNGQSQTTNLSGFADMRFRLSALLLGAPPVSVADFAKQEVTRTILGASLSIQAPTGQYFSDKLINLGTGRWAFKPELALSQPISKRWLIDVYAGVWLFTANDSYYSGNVLRSQNGIVTFQSHVSYNIRPNMWTAFDATYYAGGNSTINGVPANDQVSNFRVGATLVLPTGRHSGLKIAFSKGAVVIKGTDFTKISVGWNYSWF